MDKTVIITAGAVLFFLAAVAWAMWPRKKVRMTPRALAEGQDAGECPAGFTGNGLADRNGRARVAASNFCASIGGEGGSGGFSRPMDRTTRGVGSSDPTEELPRQSYRTGFARVGAVSPGLDPSLVDSDVGVDAGDLAVAAVAIANVFDGQTAAADTPIPEEKPRFDYSQDAPRSYSQPEPSPAPSYNYREDPSPPPSHYSPSPSPSPEPSPSPSYSPSPSPSYDPSPSPSYDSSPSFDSSPSGGSD